MHGLGNDFILIDERQKQLSTNLSDLGRLLCHRHTGIGADGVIRVLPSTIADFKMEIINPDGSVAEMCGNGIRCFARYLFDHDANPKTNYKIETGAGILSPVIEVEGGRVAGVTVDMGLPVFDVEKIPMKGYTNHAGQRLSLPDGEFRFTAVSMGNPHVVIFCDETNVKIEDIELQTIGPLVEYHPSFPSRTNVHFVNVLSASEIKVRHWERGAGATMACGTGACACVVAGVLDQQLERDVTVHVPGGDLQIRWDQATSRVFMQGPAETVFEGELNSKWNEVSV